jgi:hypothetical protein
LNHFQRSPSVANIYVDVDTDNHSASSSQLEFSQALTQICSELMFPATMKPRALRHAARCGATAALQDDHAEMLHDAERGLLPLHMLQRAIAFADSGADYLDRTAKRPVHRLGALG